MKGSAPRSCMILFVCLTAIGCHHSVQAKPPQVTNGAVVDGVEIRGNQAIPSEAVLAKITTKRGDKIDAAVIQQDVTRVRSLGFDDVQVREENGPNGGKMLIFSVMEKPLKPVL